MTAALDSRSLALFLAVAETLNFRQAAEGLHLSQPPLSRAIRELEERIGARLFDRDTHSVTLTDTGRGLVPHARAVASALRAAEVHVMAGPLRTSLRIGVTSAFESTWIPSLLERLQRTLGDTRITVTSDASPKLVRLLRSAKLDAAFIALPTATTGLDVIALERMPMMVAIASTHRLAKKRRVRLADLAGERLFWFQRARQPAFFDHCEAIFKRHGFAPRRVPEPTDHHVLLADVAAGKAFALLPASFARLRRSGVRYLALSEGGDFSVGVGLATSQDGSALRDLLADLHAQLRPDTGVGLDARHGR